jgi:hypothetical protein
LTQVLLQITTTPPIPPRRLRPDLPAPAEAAILHALAKQPVDRFKSAGEFAKALTLGLKGEWAPGLRQATTVDTFAPQPTMTAAQERRRGLLAQPQLLIAGVSALLLVAIASTLLISGAFSPKSGGTTLVFSPTATNTLALATASATASPTPPAVPTATNAPLAPTSTPIPPPTFTPIPTPTPAPPPNSISLVALVPLGQSEITFKATTDLPVDNTGFYITIVDITTQVLLAKCTTGSTCSTQARDYPTGHSIVAYVQNDQYVHNTSNIVLT